VSTKMTIEEREQFLAAVRIGVLSIADDGRGPLTAPVWYGYEPGGDVWILTGANSLKGKALEKVERASLCVQTEDAPYKYVSIEGPIVARETPDPEAHGRFMAHRYLGKEMGDAYVAGNSGGETSTLYRIKPERWLNVDYAKMMAG
jgi:nitroimidazol reductase NimA-like FMN-containing flavoprotein (pyridoxamine 5'-phosphate oxidase superfamily)